MVDALTTPLTIIATLGGISLYLPSYVSFVVALSLGLLWFFILDKKLTYHIIKWTVVVLQSILAVIIAGYAAVVLGYDSSYIVLDEFIAVPFLFLFVIPWRYSHPYVTCVAALALFSIVDSVKPLGIQLAQDLPGGLGIIADDIFAAVLAGALVTTAHYVFRVATY